MTRASGDRWARQRRGGADVVIITDDNPRSEPPAAIRAAVRGGAPGAIEIGDRAAAIAAGLERLRAGDVLVVAGKGHEQGQVIGERTVAFDDAGGDTRAGGRMSALWTAPALARATGGVFAVPFAATGVSIDSRTLSPG